MLIPDITSVVLSVSKHSLQILNNITEPPEPLSQGLPIDIETTTDLLDALTSIESKVEVVVKLIVYVIALCSIISSFLPPPLDKDDKITTVFDKIRTYKVYSWIRSTIDVFGSNVGWARNVTSKSGLRLIHNIILGLGSAKAAQDLADAAIELNKNKKQDEEDNKPVDKNEENDKPVGENEKDDKPVDENDVDKK